jgi:phosphate transport system permease protein
MSVAQERVPGPAAFERRGRFRPGDAIFYVVALAAALSGVVLLALITREVLVEAWPAMHRFGLHFLTTQAWGDKGNTVFGARSFIFGTMVTSFGALLLATPISLAIALFLTELAPRWIRQIV